MATPPKRIFTTEELLANKGKFVKVNAAGDGYEGSTGASSSLKECNALITQSGTNAPTAKVLGENTLGTVTFAYVGGGYYNIVVGHVVDLDKLWYLMPSVSNGGAGSNPSPVWIDTPTVGVGVTTIPLCIGSADDVTYNGKLNNFPITIREYS